MNEDPIRLTLPARQFATGWLNVWQSTGHDDGGPPAIYRTIVAEAAGDGMRLWATNSYTLFRSSLDTEGEPIDDDETGPIFVAMNHDQRAKALLTYVMKDATPKDKPNAVIEVYTATSETGGATLTPDLMRGALVLEYENERLALDLYEGEAVEWRGLTKGLRTEAAEGVALNPDVALKPLVGLKTAGIEAPPVEFTWGGSHGAASVIVRCDPVLHGVVMPVRIEEKD